MIGIILDIGAALGGVSTTVGLLVGVGTLYSVTNGNPSDVNLQDGMIASTAALGTYGMLRYLGVD